jgi:hypothetical protein
MMCAVAGAAWAQAIGLGVKLDGDVQAEQGFSADQVKAFPPRHVDVSYQTMHGTAYRQDDRPGDLPALKLIVPGDRMGARMIRDVTEVEVD